MKRLKIDYGIDLGTTNSAICRMDKGETLIIKSDTLKDTMPSCVAFTKRQTIKVGDTAYNDLKSDKRRATKTWKNSSSNVYVEFKRNMGTTEKYSCSNIGKDFLPEELSAEVLKTLKSFVQDEDVRSVVITVPAKFKQNQKDATMQAARLAGFEHCELLQEPIAASMAYGLTGAEKDGLWLVFDFGGGTFDAALVKTEDGIMQVFDTEGDNYLGGKNLDEAIVDHIIIPYLKENYTIDEILSDPQKKQVLRDAMKTYAEEVKNQLSFKVSEDIITDLGDLGCDDEGEELELDMTITQEQLKAVVTPSFQRAIDICMDLLRRNNLTGKQLSKVILVGGPTHSPVVRQMLREQISDNVDTSVDPMTVVASGAALYASTLDNNVKVEKELGTVYLNVGYESTSVETSEIVTVKLDKQQTTSIGTVFVELTRADKAWASGKHEINEVGDVIDVELLEGKSNAFILTAYDSSGTSIPCFPNEITIIQGTVVGRAPLAYNIGIERWDNELEMGVFEVFKGLEKNKPLPAIGTLNGLKTTCAIRPGCADDKIRIPIYEADAYEGKERASYFNLTYTIEITGEQIPALLPENSDVDLTFKCNDSGWQLLVYIPALDYTLDDVELPTETKQSVTERYLKDEINKAQNNLDKLKEDDCDVFEAESALSNVQDELDNGAEKHQVLTHLREALRKIDRCDSSSQWTRYEKKLRSAFKMLEEDNGKFGNDKTTQQVEEVRKRVDTVIRNQDISMAKDLLDVMHALNFQIARIEYFQVWIAGWCRDVDTISWKNATQARQLLERGMQLVMSNASADQLEPIVGQIIRLLPNNAIPAGASGLLK
jgi:molecular chaperone DnaK